VRALYQCLLLLHPPAFRRRFAAEMLFIFDEAAQSTGGPALIFDGVVSLARQWLLRSASWKLAVAILGACIEITAGGLIWLAPAHLQSSARAPAMDVDGMETLMTLIIGSVMAIVVMVAAASLWTRSFIRSRRRSF
jgi:hypothetical protein